MTGTAAGSIYVSDPVHGFISVPNKVLFPLLQTPHVQRLRRIRQLGIVPLVFPGAEHTRFAHAVGAMALMGRALRFLAQAGTPISRTERYAAMAAALLHDVGHTPLSHALEGRLILKTSHEVISAALIRSLCEKLGPPLDLALEIFNGSYDRTFFHELISGQLDTDRLDYLQRDSHFTGVIEGRIGIERILHTMCVHPVAGGKGSHIAVRAKGISAVENMLIARRLMYWQVYLHKTVIAGDRVLWSVFDRARSCLQEGNLCAVEGVVPALRFFLEQSLPESALNNPEVLDRFLRLDDTDVWVSLKAWSTSTDRILADLAGRFLRRDLFRCTFLDKYPSASIQEEWGARVRDSLCAKGLSTPHAAAGDVHYYLAVGCAKQAAYTHTCEKIRVVDKQGKLFYLSKVSDAASLQTLTEFAGKPYVCYPKDVALPV